MKPLIGIAFAALIWLFAANAVMAQGQNCGPRDAVLTRLAEGYGETRQSVGLVQGGAVMEIFANLDTGSWSAIVTRPGGISCFVASGQAFERITEELPASGDPT